MQTITCRSCGQKVNFASLDGPTCPYCSGDVRGTLPVTESAQPEPAQSVQPTASVTPKKQRIVCPTCQAKFVHPGAAGKYACQRCKTIIHVGPLRPSDQKSRQPSDSRAAASPLHDTLNDTSDTAPFTTPITDTPAIPEAQTDSSPVHIDVHSALADNIIAANKPTGRLVREHIEVVSAKPVPPIDTYIPRDEFPRKTDRRVRHPFYVSPRWVYRGLYFTFWLGPLALSLLHFFVSTFIVAATDGAHQPSSVLPCFCCVGVLWFMFGYWPSHYLRALLAPLFVTVIRCPLCAFERDPVDRWSAGGYTDHRERHIFDFKSPIDGTVIGRIPCPRCEATILIR